VEAEPRRGGPAPAAASGGRTQAAARLGREGEGAGARWVMEESISRAGKEVEAGARAGVDELLVERRARARQRHRGRREQELGRRGKGPRGAGSARRMSRGRHARKATAAGRGRTKEAGGAMAVRAGELAEEANGAPAWLSSSARAERGSKGRRSRARRAAVPGGRGPTAMMGIGRGAPACGIEREMGRKGGEGEDRGDGLLWRREGGEGDERERWGSGAAARVRGAPAGPWAGLGWPGLRGRLGCKALFSLSKENKNKTEIGKKRKRG